MDPVDIVSLTRSLVDIDSTTGREGECGRWLADYLRGRGWTVVMGDVCGKGPDAAAVTALARYTLRAAAMRERLPSRSLSLLKTAVGKR